MSGAQVEAQLRARLEELRGRADAIEEDMRNPMDDDFAEQAIEREDDQVLDGIEHMLRTEIGEIERALDRLQAGTYGRCEACGKEIGAARLLAQPTATRCIACA